MHGCDYSSNGGTSWTKIKMQGDNQTAATGVIGLSFPLGSNSYLFRCHDIYNNTTTTPFTLTGVASGVPAITITSISPLSAGSGTSVAVNVSVTAPTSSALATTNPVVLSNSGISNPASPGAMTFVSGSTAAGGTSTWVKNFVVATTPDGDQTATAVCSAVTAAGTTGSASSDWTLLDLTPPYTVLDSVPTSITTLRDAVLVYHGVGGAVSFKCALDSSTFTNAACGVEFGYTNLSGLAVGTHTFSVQAVDIKGNTDATPASTTWTVTNYLGTTPTPVICTAQSAPPGCYDLCGTGTNLTASPPTVFGTPNYLPGLPVAGTYLVKYVDGCMKYNGAQWWAVHAKTNFEWYMVTSPNDSIKVRVPGTTGYYPSLTPPPGILPGYSTLSACVTANQATAPIAVTHPGGQLGLWLKDTPYGDNLVSTPTPLTWNVTRIAPHGTCGP